MLNRIIERHNKISPLSETEIKIVTAALRLFLEKGFSATTHRQVAEKSGVGLGTVTYHFRAKEDMLRILVEELMDYHLDFIEYQAENTEDRLFSYAAEIAVQIALCESNRSAWDLYSSAYNLPQTYEVIKAWAAEKNYNLFHERLPDWTEHDFKHIEEVASGIELAALKSVCDRHFTLEKKISLFLNSLMMLYHVSEEERKAVTQKVLSLDYEKIAKEMFDKFVARLDGDKQNE